MPLVNHYREWIEQQRVAMAAEISLRTKRAKTVEILLTNAGKSAARMARGIELLTQPDCLEAFRLANQAMATAARQRSGPMQGKSVAEVAHHAGGRSSWPFS